METSKPNKLKFIKAIMIHPDPGEEGKYILVNLEDARASYRVNEVGHSIIEFIQKDMTTEGIIQRLHREYSAESGQINSSVMDYLRRLQELGLVSEEN